MTRIFFKFISCYWVQKKILELIETVRDEQNAAVRATFITSAAFIGYLLGRRGFFRRTFMAMIAAGAAAATCEPKMARDYAEVSFELAKSKISETYHQYGGIKDKPFFPHIPNIYD